MDFKQLLAPTISNEEFTARYGVLHKQVYAAPPFDFEKVTTHMYSAPEGFHTIDHCLLHDGENWHLFYITGETKYFERWQEGHRNKEKDVNKKFPYEMGDGHAAGKTLEELKFQNFILTEPQDKFADLTQCDIHVVRFRDHWVGLYQFYGPQTRMIGKAVSGNLFDWVPDSNNPAFTPPAWANQTYTCKDVHIAPWKGVFLVYYVVMGLDGFQAIALKVTADFETYEEVGPVFKVPNMARGTRGIESPCIIERNGMWHLFFGWGIYGVWHVVSNRPDTFNGTDLSGWSGSQDKLDYGMYSMGAFHAPEVIEHNGKWFMTTTKKEELRRADCENGVLKFRGSIGDESRLKEGIFRTEIWWDGDYPVCVKP